jgi:hypothetical protein
VFKRPEEKEVEMRGKLEKVGRTVVRRREGSRKRNIGREEIEKHVLEGSLCFLERSRYFFIEVSAQLSSRS